MTLECASCYALNAGSAPPPYLTACYASCQTCKEPGACYEYRPHPTPTAIRIESTPSVEQVLAMIKTPEKARADLAKFGHIQRYHTFVPWQGLKHTDGTRYLVFNAGAHFLPEVLHEAQADPKIAGILLQTWNFERQGDKMTYSVFDGATWINAGVVYLGPCVLDTFTVYVLRGVALLLGELESLPRLA